ncbi:Mu transposase C-terminal domain-containing protein [Sodalis endosymbiont of Spalangia cameroni]|uniref:Mu transposase C-terminal domain-containing protein n=1 Tax=Sodalis praecaptivus TaxID=1239307 RepID=UPI0031F80593
MFVSANELLKIPGLPETVQGMRLALNKWSKDSDQMKRKRTGTKAFEYHIDCLPEQAREIVRQRHYKSLIAQAPAQPVDESVKRGTAIKSRDELAIMRQCPALLERKVQALNDHQKQIADARMMLAQEVIRLQQAGMTRIAAVTFIVEESKAGTLPEALQRAATLANAKKGRTRQGVGKSSLQEWVSLYLSAERPQERLAILAPGQPKKQRPEDMTWFYALFWPHYARPCGPTVLEAYRAFQADWQGKYHDQPAMLAARPTYDKVNRMVKRVAPNRRVKGRVTGSALKAYQVYQQRDWAQMPVNGCWIADGKSLNMKVAHPIHGRPFTPELTLVLDGRTRYLVGWSLSLAENAIAVADAWRYAIQHHGKPLFAYSDNGGGETNKMLDADITGIFPRLGIEHITGIPGNPQARGIIERLNGVLPRRLALRFQTYNGLSADPNGVRVQGQKLLSLSNALRQGKELNPVQQKTLAILPSWRQLIDAIEDEVQRYNHSHEHSALPKVNGKSMTPAAYRKALLAEEGDDIEYLTPGELREMFMPEEKRVAQRGWVELLNNQYFARELIEVDRQTVRVAYDIHNPNEVIIRQMDGAYLCTALWNGNTASPVPVSRVEKALEARAKRRIKLAESKIQDAKDELRPVIDAPRESDYSLLIPKVSAPEKEKVYLFESEYEHDIKQVGNNR